jgi:hypothetical protein
MVVVVLRPDRAVLTPDLLPRLAGRSMPIPCGMEPLVALMHLDLWRPVSHVNKIVGGCELRLGEEVRVLLSVLGIHYCDELGILECLLLEEGHRCLRLVTGSLHGVLEHLSVLLLTELEIAEFSPCLLQ